MQGSRARQALVAPLVSAALLTGIAFAASPAVIAATFHGYSYGYISGGPYTGLAATRYDLSPGGMPSGSNCTQYFTYPVIYQTQWLAGNASDNYTWYELGTGHQCNGFEYWYGGWGYYSGSTAVWNPVFTQTITGAAVHRFYLQEVMVPQRGSTMFWQIDNTQMASHPGGYTGASDEAGLESYVSSASEPIYSISSLSDVVNYGGWQNWAGTSEVDTGLPMCGSIVNATTYDAGENNC